MNDAAPATATQPVPTEIDVGSASRRASPMRTVILVALLLLLVLFVYHVLSDRYTPYTSQARVETFLTQVAPEVAGDVLEVGVKDNGPVRKASCCSASIPSPMRLPSASAEANLSVALQAADVSVADIAAARAQMRSSAPTCAANRELEGS